MQKDWKAEAGVEVEVEAYSGRQSKQAPESATKGTSANIVTYGAMIKKNVEDEARAQQWGLATAKSRLWVMIAQHVPSTCGAWGAI